MDKDFEKRLKEKMDSASLQDIMPGFDKEATWAEIDERMSERKKRVLPLWFNYAAAVAVGLLLGGGLVKMWWKDTVVVTQLAQVIVKKTPTTIQPVDTMTNKVDVQIAVPQSVPVHTNTNNIAKTKPQTKPAVDTQAPSLHTPKTDDIPTTPTPDVQQDVVAQTTTQPIKKRKTVHLLDIENEDRQTALNDVSAQSATRVRMVMQVPLQPVESGGNHQSVMLRNIIK